LTLNRYFDFPGSNDLTFTLNIDNIKNDHMRQLVSKVKIKNLFKSIIKTPLKDTKPPKFDSKTALLANKLEDTFWIIKTLWLEKQANEDALPSGKLTIFKKAMLQASNELAAVNKILPSKAKSQILAGLNFSQK